ncbi:hypothetical protein CBL_11964 [Carabus blaptoides fortunei]
MSLTVRPKCVQCNSAAEAMFYEDKDWKCRACKTIRRSCSNSNMGCEYVDITCKCIKHERYFCPFNKCCRICTNTIDNGSLDQHYIKTHAKIIHSSCTKFNADVLSNNWTRYLIKTDFGKVVVIMRRQGITEMFLLIRSPLSSDQVSKYLCVIELSHPTTGLEITYTFEATNNHVDDWCVLILDNDLSMYIDNNKVTVKIEFIKKLI